MDLHVWKNSLATGGCCWLSWSNGCWEWRPVGMAALNRDKCGDKWYCLRFLLLANYSYSKWDALWKSIKEELFGFFKCRTFVLHNSTLEKLHSLTCMFNVFKIHFTVSLWGLRFSWKSVLQLVWLDYICGMSRIDMSGSHVHWVGSNWSIDFRH